MNILAIETSCDETSIAIVEAKGSLKNPQFKIRKNIVSSQIPIHAPFGGVVPMLAKREHLKNLPKVWNRLKKLESSIDAIAVTVGPGLEPALWTGINFAKELSKELKKPLFGVNHLEGHLYSFLANVKNAELKNIFPAIALIVSGGHTIILKMDSLSKYKKLGETRDDAAGEAYDKIAKMMKLPYPGGPQIERLAKKGDPKKISFPRPMLHDKNYEFSFSGLKTAVLYHLRDNKDAKPADVAASFEEAVIEVLTKKTMRAAKEWNANTIICVGGVAANKALSKSLKSEARKTNRNFFTSPKKLLTDNAGMIGIAAYINIARKKRYRLTAQPNLNL